MNYQNYENLMHLTSSDTKQTLMHLFLFTNPIQRELVLICTQFTQLQDRYWSRLHFPKMKYESQSPVNIKRFIDIDR